MHMGAFFCLFLVLKLCLQHNPMHHRNLKIKVSFFVRELLLVTYYSNYSINITAVSNTQCLLMCLLIGKYF